MRTSVRRVGKHYVLSFTHYLNGSRIRARVKLSLRAGRKLIREMGAKS